MTEAQHTCDLIVIGGGPGGYVAAIRAAQLGMQVALVERDALGGICLNWGCIPTKALLRNAEIYHLMQHGADFGLYCDNLRFDFSRVIARSRQVAACLSQGITFLMRKNKIQVLRGTGRLAGAGTVTVHDAQGTPTTTLRAAHILLATGARSHPLPGLPFDQTRVLSSTEAMVLQEVPKALVIIGAGAVGVEFAYFYNTFGTQVTLVEMLPQILPIEDSEIAGLLQKSLEKQGIAIHVGRRVEHAEITPEGVQVHMHTPEGARTVQGTGIYAIGDVNGPPCLAHVASAEGIATVEAIAGLDNPGVNYQNIPGCTYCQPQVASVGMTEEAARQAGRTIRVGRFPFSASGKALAVGSSEGLVKVIFDADTDELLGAHILGAEASDLIAEVGVARTLETTHYEVLKTVHAHPTLSEAIMEAVGNAYGEAIHL